MFSNSISDFAITVICVSASISVIMATFAVIVFMVTKNKNNGRTRDDMIHGLRRVIVKIKKNQRVTQKHIWKLRADKIALAIDDLIKSWGCIDVDDIPRVRNEQTRAIKLAINKTLWTVSDNDEDDDHDVSVNVCLYIDTKTMISEIKQSCNAIIKCIELNSAREAEAARVLDADVAAARVAGNIYSVEMAEKVKAAEEHHCHVVCYKKYLDEANASMRVAIDKVYDERDF
jgi:hypothetical protein